MTVVGDSTLPSEYVTNTDESDALALDMAAELGTGESVASAACELTSLNTGANAAVMGFPAGATVTSNVVTQVFDARGLSEGPYRWIWNVTLNTGAIRSYLTILRVRNHD
jgi:S1-C subfamily serine protease